MRGPCRGALLVYSMHMVTILDYGAGNLTSVRLAFERLGVTPRLITSADDYVRGRIVFPGVGSAGSGMEGLRARGFDALLRREAAAGTPILGICLGMQLLLGTSAEDGGVEGLGLIAGEVVPFDEAKDPSVKIPHMGWNTVRHTGHPLFAGVPQDAAFYFVHSFFARPQADADVLGRTDYCGENFASVVGHGSLVATQFHPERSGAAGAQVLRNFLNLEGPACS